MSDDVLFRRRRIEQRRRELAAEWRQINDDAARWNFLHPTDPPLVIEPLPPALAAFLGVRDDD